MLDLRSAIVKEASKVVELASEQCPELECFDRFMSHDCLYKLLASGNKILADIGHQCILSIIEKCQDYKILKKLV